MKLKLYLSIVAIGLYSSIGFAQSPQQKQRIANQYDLSKLQQLSEEITTRKIQTAKYAAKNHIQQIVKLKNGEKAFLSYINEAGIPIYIKKYNVNAAKTVGVDQVQENGDLGLNLKGENMTVGVWDGGKVRETHLLLDGKITNKDDMQEYDDHATHTSGTIAGKELTKGEGMEAQGMAPLAEIYAYDMQNDLEGMQEAAADGMLISNHSYGAFELFLPEGYGGFYDDQANIYDNLALTHKYYTMVAAAGNDRQDIFTGQPVDEPYDLLYGGMATAKNVITVAAVDKVLEYNGPESVQMSEFSSWGPSNDFRVKPDISADGVEVFSSVAMEGGDPLFGGGTPSDSIFEAMDGTSMASPNVAGGLLLLQELSSDLNNGEFLKSATLKALAIGTARQASETPGPDARYGWGLLSIADAAQLMIDKEEDNGDFYDELTLKNGETYTNTVTANGTEDIKVTIVWTDPTTEAQEMEVIREGDGIIDPGEIEVEASSVLVNDLDLRITDESENKYYPWRLDTTDFEAPAINTEDNNVDNVEKIEITAPVEGEEYTISVNHKGELENNKQEFSLVVSGIEYDPLSNEEHELEEFTMYPNPAANEVHLNLNKVKTAVEVTVYDVNGKTVTEETFTGITELDQSINTSELNSGIYFVKLSANETNQTKKLIIK